MSQRRTYDNETIATNSAPYSAEAMAVEDEKVVSTGISSRRCTALMKSTSSRIVAVT
jgi:hypothetical protein